MAADIYNIDQWLNGTTYSVNDIVWYKIADLNGVQRRYYWYATVDHTASSAPSLTNAQWAGMKYDQRTNKNKPTFTWRPSYNFSVTSKPNVSVIKFGHGYEQRLVDGIDSDLLEADVNFETRDQKEARAIAHFFHIRRAKESFVMQLPPPYNIDKLFVAREWSTTFNFYNNYSIRARVSEVTQ